MDPSPVPKRERTDDFVYLTTTGRRSGRPHEIEIWYAESLDGRSLYLLAGGGTRSDWVANLVAEPRCSLRRMGVTFGANARMVGVSAGPGPGLLSGEAIGAEEERFAREAVFAKYELRNPGLASWRDSALPVAIDLAARESSAPEAQRREADQA